MAASMMVALQPYMLSARIRIIHRQKSEYALVDRVSAVELRKNRVIFIAAS